MPREPPPSNAMSSWFTCWSTTRAHQLPVHRRPFPLQRWQRVLQKPLCWCKIFYCFFVDCWNAQNRSQHRHVLHHLQWGDSPGVVLKQHTGSKNGEQPWREAAACLLHSLLKPPTQLCQPSLEALQTWSYLELPVMIILKCIAAQQFR